METIKEAIKWATLSPTQRNELIAERVMGAQRITCPSQGQDHNHGNLVFNHDQQTWRCRTCNARSQGEDDELFQHAKLFYQCPRYSENLDDTWKIVKHSTFTEVVLHYLEVRRVGTEPLCRYTCNVASVGVYVHAHGRTPAHALCVASLRAIGVEVQE